jgi:hypothetical protein
MGSQQLINSCNITSFRPMLWSEQPLLHWTPGAVPTRIKWPVREADHSPPSNAVNKNVWSLTTTPIMSSRPWHLIRHRHTLTFRFILSYPRLVFCLHYVRVFITDLQSSQIRFVVSCSEIGKTQKLRCGDRARYCILLQTGFKTCAVCMKTHLNISATKIFMRAFISSSHCATGRS